MATESANQKQIITHAVLAGLTPLIPIPFVDDMVKTYFQRRLVRNLIASQGQSLSDKDIKTLADDRGGCLLGCIGSVLLYPAKKIFRKIFFFLEWKRAVDIVSHLYYHGYLLDHAFENRWIAPAGSRPALEVRNAIDAVLKQVNTSLIERAVWGTFNQSKSALKASARLLQRSLQRVKGKPTEDQVAQAVEEVEPEEERELEGVIARLQKAIESMPAEHFEQLRLQLAAALNIDQR